MNRRNDGDVEILLQRRPANKDTSPNLWDVSVGGHYSAGEGLEGGIREMQEELGLSVSPADLIQAGWRHNVAEEPGIHDREVQDIFFLHRALRLEDLRPDPAEVPEVALVSGADLRKLAQGRVLEIRAIGGLVDPNSLVQKRPLVLVSDELVPRENHYYEKAVRFGRALVGGKSVGRRRRWW